jgi:branched-chain amino acid transport system permease protein
VALLLGGLLAALAGIWSGCRRLRLRGDYLAIVTLGFGEIIRVLILNIDVIGGARGLPGIPGWANVFWVGLGVAAVLASRAIWRTAHTARACSRSATTRWRPRRSGVDTTRTRCWRS